MRAALKRPFSTQDWAAAPSDKIPQPSSGFLPFYLIETLAVGVDLILILGLSVLTGAAYYFAFSDLAPPIETLIAVGALSGVLFTAITASRGAYRPQDLANFDKQARLTATVWLFVFFVLSLIAFAFKISSTYSRGATFTYFVVTSGVLIIWRMVLARYIARSLAEGRFAQQKVLVLAEEGQIGGLQIIEDLKRCGYLPVQIFEFARNSFGLDRGSSWLQKWLDEIVRISREEKIECVFIAASWDDRLQIDRLMQQLNVLSMPVYLLPDSNVAHFFGNRIVEVGTTWTAELKRAPLNRVERTCKRALDLIIASIGLIVLTPIILFVAAGIKLEGRGPVFFIQTRNGFNGRPFRICKFRTMSVLEDGPVIRHATKNDPRITRIGRLLRLTFMDELPQLFNVVTGSMSLVGPRPHASALNSEYEKTVANYAFRYHVKPGLTGWAQINGLRGEMELDRVAKRIEYDLWYINNWSFWLDLKILARTVIIGFQPIAY
jgi:Undecaprenyl-phosphate glucose phosphotransferase